MALQVLGQKSVRWMEELVKLVAGCRHGATGTEGACGEGELTSPGPLAGPLADWTGYFLMIGRQKDFDMHVKIFLSRSTTRA